MAAANLELTVLTKAKIASTEDKGKVATLATLGAQKGREAKSEAPYRAYRLIAVGTETKQNFHAQTVDAGILNPGTYIALSYFLHLPVLHDCRTWSPSGLVLKCL